MKKLIALFLVIAFLGMNCATYEKGKGINLEPGQKPGVKLVIQKTDGQELQGELITVKKDSFLLKDTGSGADVSVDIKDIRVIKIVRESKVGKGVGIGLLVGGGIGAAQFIAADKSGMFGGMGEMMIGGALVLLGVVFGAFTGAAAGQDITIQIEGKSDSEIKEILEDLRKKARVPDFQ